MSAPEKSRRPSSCMIDSCDVLAGAEAGSAHAATPRHPAMMAIRRIRAMNAERSAKLRGLERDRHLTAGQGVPPDRDHRPPPARAGRRHLGGPVAQPRVRAIGTAAELPGLRARRAELEIDIA